MFNSINESSEKQNNYSSSGVRIWQMVSGILAVLLVGVVILGLGYELGVRQNGGENEVEVGSETTAEQVSPQEMLAEILPTGTPAVYGAELNVEYDNVTAADPESTNQTIEELSQLDHELELKDPELERYINILYHQHDGMSCEFCCGARSIIFENGEPACGCEHSFAMRGLTKYLITEHGQDLSDEEILAEIGKWKVLFFPDIHAQKAAVMQEYGLDIDYVSLTSNTNRGLEEGAAGGGGGMIGDC